MKITIKEISNSNTWENFLLSQNQTPFFQSWWWGEVQKMIGFPILRLGIYQKNNLVGIAQIITVKAKRGTFYWIRHGPILNEWDWYYVDELLKAIVIRAKKHSVSFIRMAPLLDDTQDCLLQFKKRGFRNAPIHNFDAENAWVVNLSKSEDELLKEMRKSTRYLIRKAISIGVKVEQSTDQRKLEDFNEVYQETAQRQGFVTHKGLREEFSIFSERNLLHLFLAYHENTLVAGAMIIFYGKQAVYHHSGMREDMKHIPATYLLQWEAIKEAKRRGMKWYNLWGVAPENKPNHPWQGLTLFKKGFGGIGINHIHAQDLPVSSRYWFTWIIESVRRIKRGY